MALGFAIRGELWLVLDEENVERIQANDPFEFDVGNAGDIMLRWPFRVRVAYARKDEQAKIAALSGDPDLLLAYLTRGFKVMDSDRERGTPYEPLKKKP